VDVARTFFEDHGRLKSGATVEHAKSGFQWACEYGRTPAVSYLLQQGIAIHALHRGQTGLHWAAYAGHVEIVKLLLQHGALVHIKDERYGGTPLGWALHGWAHALEPDAKAKYHAVVAGLVAAGATVDLSSISPEKLERDPRMRTALRGEMGDS
jgi:hypothetical protein